MDERKYLPSPTEFFHDELLTCFHEFRERNTDSLSVEINGKEFSEIVVSAKKRTYERYKGFNLKDAFLASDLKKKKKEVLVHFRVWEEAGHALLDGGWAVKTKIVEVFDYLELNELFKNIVKIDKL